MTSPQHPSIYGQFAPPQNHRPQHPSSAGAGYSDELSKQAGLNASFSERSWAEVKQDGCMLPPKAYPSWPPPRGDGFVYPTMSKRPQELMTLGEGEGAGFGRPWADGASESTKHWGQGASSDGNPLPQAHRYGPCGAGALGSGAVNVSNDPPAPYDLAYTVSKRIAEEMLSGRF